MKNFLVLAGMLYATSATTAAELVVTTSQANVRAGPAATYAVVATLRQGARVQPLRVEQNYVEVGLGAGADRGDSGWLYAPAQGWPTSRQSVARNDAVPAREFALPRSETAPAPQAPEMTAADLAWTSLAELGWRNGLMFEGLSSGHRQSLRFFLPRAVSVRAARLKLGVQTVARLGPQSLLRVDINGQPVHAMTLDQAQGRQWIDVAVPARALGANASGVLEVTLRASLMMSEDRCQDDRATASYLHIDPDSGLALDLRTEGSSVLGAWEMLPKHVTLSLPLKVDEAAFATALVLMRQMGREGKTVELVRLPRLGDLAVASALDLDAALAAQNGAAPAAAAAGNVRRIEVGSRSLLAFAPERNAGPGALAAAGWLTLARGPAHTVQRAEPRARIGLTAGVDEISLERLGVDLSVREVGQRAEWQIPLGLDRVPVRAVPSQLRLTVTSAPVPEAQPVMLYAYLNGELQDVRRLSAGTEQFTLHLSPAAVKGAFNDLRVVAQRDLRGGNCQAALGVYPVQIAPGSTVVFSRNDSAPQDFGALPLHFSGGFDLFLGAEVLNKPESSLTFLAHLLGANQYLLTPARIKLQAAEAPGPAGPFLLLADTAPGVSGQVVRFDRGPMQVTGKDGSALLDIDHVDAAAVAQLVDWGAQRGLWVRPPSAAPLSDSPRLGLTSDTVAFIDADGVALTISADLGDIARMDYPAYRSWFDLFGAYRYWLMALGWMVVVVLLAQLYVKVRSHKKAH